MIDARGQRLRASISSVLVATVVVAVAGYLILFVAARALGAAGYAQFATFWSAFYLGVGAVFGIQQESTRAIASSAGQGGTRIAVWALFVAAGTVVLIQASGLLWAPVVFGGAAPNRMLLLAVGILAYAGQCVLIGSFAARGRWAAYSAVLVAEALSRLLLVVLAAVLAAGIDAFAVASVAAMLVWLSALVARSARASFLVRVDESPRRTVERFSHSVAAAAGSAVLVTGYPLILGLTRGTEPPAVLGAIILVVTLTRAPLLVPLNALQTMLVAAFVPESTRARRVVLATGAAAVAGAALAGLVSAVGRPLIALVFGADFAVAPWFLGVATLGATAIAVLTVTGAGALSASRHRLYLAGWIIAAAVSGGVLLAPIPILEAVSISLFLGPLLGVVVHAVAVRANRRHPGVTL